MIFYFFLYFKNAFLLSKDTFFKKINRNIIKAKIAIYGVIKYDNNAPINIINPSKNIKLRISRTRKSLSYNFCSFFGKVLNPDIKSEFHTYDMETHVYIPVCHESKNIISGGFNIF